MTYAKAQQAYEQKHRGMRTSYRCAANGCPNTGCIDDRGEDAPGVCYWHLMEPDRKKWDAVTLRIRSNFAEMRNHGEPMPEDLRPAGDELFEEAPFVYEGTEA